MTDDEVLDADEIRQQWMRERRRVTETAVEQLMALYNTGRHPNTATEPQTVVFSQVCPHCGRRVGPVLC